MPAIVQLNFDPVLRLTDTTSVRFETLALAVVLFGGLLLAARVGRVTPAVGPYVPAPTLQPDDLVFIVVGAVPGAVVGGRLGYVFDHLDFYQANPGAILDPAQGAMTLTLAVPLGILTGGLIARLIGAPVARWMHACALPLLYVLAMAKLVGILGATGQGAASDVPWATAYGGPGPWGSLAASIPSHPSQLYEAGLVGVAIVALSVLSRLQVVARRDGGALFLALGMWAIARFAVAFTWRDPVAAGPLRMEQLLALGVLLVALVGLIERARAKVASGRVPRIEAEAKPA